MDLPVDLSGSCLECLASASATMAVCSQRRLQLVGGGGPLLWRPRSCGRFLMCLNATDSFVMSQWLKFLTMMPLLCQQLQISSTATMDSSVPTMLRWILPCRPWSFVWRLFAVQGSNSDSQNLHRLPRRLVLQPSLPLPRWLLLLHGAVFAWCWNTNFECNCYDGFFHGIVACRRRRWGSPLLGLTLLGRGERTSSANASFACRPCWCRSASWMQLMMPAPISSRGRRVHAESKQWWCVCIFFSW
jgi:hypothetical protein